MSFLTEPLKNTVEVLGKSYPVNTDFRVWLRFYELICEKGIDEKSAAEAIIMCYKGGKLPPSFFKAFDALWEFFLGRADKEKSKEKGKKVFDFSYDAELIFASFLSDYGIDLTIASMHWHKFLSLFKSLSPDTAFMKVVAIRSMNPSEIKDRKYRDEIIKKQRIFALKPDDVCEEFAENLLKVI